MSKKKRKIYTAPKPLEPAAASAPVSTTTQTSAVDDLPPMAAMLGAYEAARHERNLRHVLHWSQLDPAREMDAYDQNILWRTSRCLYGNCPEIRKLVKDIVRLTGPLTPLPRTTDEEWNREARRVFLARTKNPGAFDLSGKLNWHSALSWMERRTALDGDCFIILTHAADGGAAFQFVQAPQVWGDGDGYVLGVKRNAFGRPTHYKLRRTADAPDAILPAHAVLHYMHEPEPGAVRGVPDVVAALCSAADIDVANYYNKEGIKYASSFGLIEKVEPGQQDESLAAALARQKQGVTEPKQEVKKSTFISGLMHVTLPKGHDIEYLHDNRPSPEARAFVEYLMRGIAYSTGLDPEMVYQLNSLTSAAARTMLEKHREWVADRHREAAVVLTRMYQYIIACEMHMGRLPRCKDERWGCVDWIASSDKTLDVGRVGNLYMELINMGLMSAEQFTLAMSGQTPVEIAESNAHWRAHLKLIAEQYGLSVAEVAPGRTGNTATSTSPSGAPRDILPADTDPEETDGSTEGDNTTNTTKK